MDKTKLTVVVDNIGEGKLPGEWGLSIHVDHRGRRILADTGASALFAANMKALGLDVSQVEFCTLSHAHYDHSQGFPAFFEENKRAKVYIQKSVGEDCYFKKLFLHRFIGIPKGILVDKPERFERVSGKYHLAEGAWLIPHNTPGLDKIGRRECMYLKTDKGWVPDRFDHEQSLVLETEKGLVIINCCSHGGVLNILREVGEAFPGQKIHGLVGGFHLFNKPRKEVRELSRRILDTGIDFVCTGHCTKERAYGVMKEELGDKLHLLHVGLSMEF